MTTSPPPFLENYDSLDIIGNGSFGIIRKVRRKSDGLIFARKELNFERMTERDRKQIVAEVNILKDLHHDHIVRYHDRFVDRDAGILYILMEYCGGGDLSTVIKHASRSGRPIPEDTIWGYFYQILHALQHCHHPNGHARSSSGNTVDFGQQNGGGGRRPQILHRDLKPDNVFLDENNTVKLGDFGLSKALPQASFANTYVGTPYYMSPELMQEKAYDSKSDIWSLGCLIYELCALKPPFHEAKTHSELSIFIRNGRIPPLPRGYSQALASVIKSMLNLNPAMRPSAAQLLQHERLELVSKVQEAEKMLTVVKNHRATVAAKEREVLQRETALLENQQRLHSVLTEKEQQIAHLQQLLTQAQAQPPTTSLSPSDPHLQALIKAAVSARETELRTLVMEREAEVARAIALREEEIMEAVRKREEDVMEAVRAREAEMEEFLRIRQQELEEGLRSMEENARNREREVEEAVRKREQELMAVEEELNQREEEIKREEMKLTDTKKEMEVVFKKVQSGTNARGRKEKNPLEEVKNVLEPLARKTQQNNHTQTRTRRPTASSTTSTTSTAPSPPSSASHSPTPQQTSFPALSNPLHAPLVTPAATRRPPAGWPPMSAMKGVVLTATGEPIATPMIGQGGLFKGGLIQTPMANGGSHAQIPFTTPRPKPVELAALFEKSPRVGLNFGRIFDFEEGATISGNKETGQGQESKKGVVEEEEEEEPLPPSPSLRTQREKTLSKSKRVGEKDKNCDDVSASAAPSHHTQPLGPPPPPTRIRRPSIRTSGRSTNGKPASSMAAVAAADAAREQHPQQQQHSLQAKPLPHPHLKPSTSNNNLRSAASSSAVASGSGSTASITHVPFPGTGPVPEYDLADEENLPSPFLKRGERADKGISLKGNSIANPTFTASSSANANGTAGKSVAAITSCANSNANANMASTDSSSTKAKRRASSGLLLRAVAAANNAGRRQGYAAAQTDVNQGASVAEQESAAADPSARPSLASARKASEDARKALLRP
ncbi:kinase-like protein [Pholiota conissans]|uniref:non-specific serine/threonine protein kinase n=1 Tax=Pholiota conissans TaxID=109636 RepID=A0A9P6CVZ7_9AGAR|nr:kinase-like protein [Pholiota conissans]